jgi:hypothetical protein
LTLQLFIENNNDHPAPLFVGETPTTVKWFPDSPNEIEGKNTPFRRASSAY